MWGVKWDILKAAVCHTHASEFEGEHCCKCNVSSDHIITTKTTQWKCEFCLLRSKNSINFSLVLEIDYHA